MENYSKIILIRGNSGSGKTSVAKILQSKLGEGTFLISQDTVRREMLMVKDKKGNEAVSLLCELVKYGRENCEIVILEGILNSEIYYELFQTVKNEYNSNIFAYYYDLPFEETVLRHKTSLKVYDFNEDDMKKWWKDKDYIGFIKEKILTKNLNMESIVKLILKDIKRRINVENITEKSFNGGTVL